MPRSLPTRALLLGGPFLFCFLTGQIGGWGGPVLFGLILLLTLWMPGMALATGAPIRKALPFFIPAVAGAAGFAAGVSLPTFVGIPKALV